MTTKHATTKKTSAKANRGARPRRQKAHNRVRAGKPADVAAKPVKGTPEAGEAKRPRTGTKQADMIAMLKRSEGATIAEFMTATGWQAHTVRGAFAGALKKRLGLSVDSKKDEGRGRVYRIAS